MVHGSFLHYRNLWDRYSLMEKYECTALLHCAQNKAAPDQRDDCGCVLLRRFVFSAVAAGLNVKRL